MYAMFKDNVWAADLADFGSLASKNWDVNYELIKEENFAIILSKNFYMIKIF